MSMWNAFDFSIFLLFMTYAPRSVGQGSTRLTALLSFYALRIIGLFMPNDKVYITEWSYDILASCSIFLFPRIFSVLYCRPCRPTGTLLTEYRDHYRYFSQLIIAFRSV